MRSEWVEMTRGQWPQSPWPAKEMKLLDMSADGAYIVCRARRKHDLPLILKKEGGSNQVGGWGGSAIAYVRNVR